MPITPYTTPLKTEYKPLGIDKFFEPLSQMQSKYDVAKTEIDDTRFKLARMSQDDPSAAPILEDLNRKTEELSQNLVRTGNYRQAAQKLSELNRSYAEDKGLQAYTTSYTNYTDAVANQKERIGQEKDGITQEQFDLWNYKIQETWDGTTYDETTDTYDILSPGPILANQEDNMREEALKLANMAEMQQYDQMVRDGFDKYGDAQELKKVFKYRDRAQVAEEINNFLSTSDKYSAYIEDLAKKRHFYNQNESKKARARGERQTTEAEEVVAISLETIEKGIKEAQESGETGIEENLQATKNNILGVVNKYQRGDEQAFEQLAEDLAARIATGDLQNIAMAASDLKDTTQISTTYIKNDSGAGKEASEKFDKVGNLSTNSSILSYDATLSVQEGLSPFTQEENEKAGVLDITEGTQKIYDESYNKEYSTAGGRYGLGIEGTPIGVGENTSRNSYAAATADYLQTFSEGYENRKSELLQERANLVNAKSTATIGTDKKMFADQIATIDKDLRDSEIANNAQIKNLEDLLTTGEYAIHNQSQEIKDLWEASGKDPIKFVASLENPQKQEEVEPIIELTEDDLIKPLTEEERFLMTSGFDDSSPIKYNNGQIQWPGSYTDDPEMVKYLFNLNNQVISSKNSGYGGYYKTQEAIDQEFSDNWNASQIESFTERYGVTVQQAMANVVDKENEVTGTSKYGVDLLTEFNKKITIDGDTYALPLEINMNDNFNAMTDDAGAEVSEVFSKQRGAQKYPAVHYDTTTGELVPITNGGESVYINYNPALYDWELGSYVGCDEEGIPIFKYPVVTSTSSDAAGNKADQQLFGTLLQKKLDSEKVKKIDLSTFNDITGYKTDNPDVIYLSAAGISKGAEVLTGIRDYYLDGIKLAQGNISQERKTDIIETTLNNYAPLWLIGNPEKRTQYVTAAKNLQQRQQAGVFTDNVVQGPAIWNQIDDKNYYGNMVQYITTGEGELVKKVIRIFGKYDNDSGQVQYSEENNKVIKQETIRTPYLALSMAEDALVYGVGQEDSLPTDKNGRPIVLDFILNPQK